MMRHHRWRLACAGVLMWIVGMTPLFAQPDLTHTLGSTVADRPSASYVFSDLRLDSVDGQRRYRVRIATPKAAAPAAGYPVVYLLDGNAALMELDERLLDSLSTHGVAPVLVFIADDSALRIDAVGRSLDYTPARFTDGRVETDPLNPQRRTGGAAAFAQLIATRIRPQVEARVSVDRQRQTLWGHSYGGLFVLQMLLTQPQLFQHYVAVDPSVVGRWVYRPAGAARGGSRTSSFCRHAAIEASFDADGRRGQATGTRCNTRSSRAATCRPTRCTESRHAVVVVTRPHRRVPTATRP